MALPPRPAERGEADRAHLPWERAASGRGASGRGASDEFFKPIHLVNELVTPEVEYRTWKEFVDLVYLVQDEFCASSIDMYNNDVGKKSAQKFMKQTGNQRSGRADERVRREGERMSGCDERAQMQTAPCF